MLTAHLQLAIFDVPGGVLLADYSVRAEHVTASTNEHGYEALHARVPLLLEEAFRLYDRPGLPHVELNDSYGARVWEGRLEDVVIWAGDDDGGVVLTALGYVRSLTDARYTALWSTTSVADWRPSTEDDVANRRPKLYAMDTENRLFVGLTHNTTYTTGADPGGMTFETPNGTDSTTRTLVGAMYAITVALPLNWSILLRSFSRDWSGGVTILTLTGTGATYTRAVLATFAGADRLEFQIFNNSGANLTFPGENGANFIKITKLRVVSSIANVVSTTLTANRPAGVSVTATVGSTARMYAGMQLVIASAGNPSEIVTVESVTSTTQFVATFASSYVIGNAVQGFIIYADEIVQDLLSTTTALNSTQIATSTALIQSPGLDLSDEIYEDAVPLDILTDLAALGDNQTLPRQWEAGITDQRLLYFRPRSSAARTWYVDVSELEIDRTLDLLHNGAYATYRDAAGRTFRTTVSDDSASIARYGLTRRESVGSRTTSVTQAGVERTAYLQDAKDPLPRATIRFHALYDASGARWPLWSARSGDTIVVRNLAPTLSTSIDRIRIFRLAHTEYHAGDADEEDTLVVEPEAPPTAQETLLGRLAAGVTAVQQAIPFALKHKKRI